MAKRKDYSGQAFGRVVDNNRGKRARTPPCRMNGARGGAPEGKRNGNYRHGARTKEMIEVWKLIKSLR